MSNDKDVEAVVEKEEEVQNRTRRVEVNYGVEDTPPIYLSLLLGLQVEKGL